MEQRLKNLKAIITHKAADPAFKHHQWFVQWHLEIVEALSRDMLALYADADEAIVIAMAWLHDYGKIINFDTQYHEEHRQASYELLLELGFDQEFAEIVIQNIRTLDAKTDIAFANIETRIVSSADGCSHLVGPFQSLYWWENPAVSYRDIMKENSRKQLVDWNQKVVIPEARSAYAAVHQSAMDRSNGIIIHIDK